MKDFESLIVSRQSARKFTERKLSPDDVQKILQAALLAPTSRNSRSYEFVAVENETVLKQLSECKNSTALFLAESALAIVVLGDRTKSDCWIEDASLAAIYMQLQAEDLGLGSCWCQVRGRSIMEEDSEHYVRELLHIPHNYGVLCIIGFGYKAQEGNSGNLSKPAWEKVHIEYFNGGFELLMA
ncbi:MAG: nitroreductase family protein [Tannerella sp.]|jgi:nitroreductase|nr:nitroreductase family protein [Tannerella sp.]